MSGSVLPPPNAPSKPNQRAATGSSLPAAGDEPTANRRVETFAPWREAAPAPSTPPPLPRAQINPQRIGTTQANAWRTFGSARRSIVAFVGPHARWLAYLALTLLALVGAAWQHCRQPGSAFTALAPHDRPSNTAIEVLATVEHATTSRAQAEGALLRVADRIVEHFGSDYLPLAAAPAQAAERIDRYALWYVESGQHEPAKERLSDDALQRRARNLALSLQSPLSGGFADAWRRDPLNLRELAKARLEVLNWRPPACDPSEQSCTAARITPQGALLHDDARALLLRVRQTRPLPETRQTLRDLGQDLGVQLEVAGAWVEEQDRREQANAHNVRLIIACAAAFAVLFAALTRQMVWLATQALVATLCFTLAGLVAWQWDGVACAWLMLATIPALLQVHDSAPTLRAKLRQIVPWLTPWIALAWLPQTLWHDTALACIGVMVASSAAIHALVRSPRFVHLVAHVLEKPSNGRFVAGSTARYGLDACAGASDPQPSRRATIVQALLASGALLVCAAAASALPLGAHYRALLDAPRLPARERIRDVFFDLDGQVLQRVRGPTSDQALMHLRELAAPTLPEGQAWQHVDDPGQLFLTSSEENRQREFIQSIDPEGRALALEKALTTAGLRAEAFGEFLRILRHREAPPKLHETVDPPLRNWQRELWQSSAIATDDTSSAPEGLHELHRRYVLRGRVGQDLKDGTLATAMATELESLDGPLPGVLRDRKANPLVMTLILACAFALMLLASARPLNRSSTWIDAQLALWSVTGAVVLGRMFGAYLNAQTLPACLVVAVAVFECRRQPPALTAPWWLGLAMSVAIGLTLATADLTFSSTWAAAGVLLTLGCSLGLLAHLTWQRFGKRVLAWLQVNDSTSAKRTHRP